MEAELTSDTNVTKQQLHGRTKTQLSPELVSLIHHVELHRSGWWQLAIQKLILAALWLSVDNAADEQSICAALKDNFGIELNLEAMRAQLDLLLRQQTIVVLPSGAYKIPEATLADCERQLKETESVEEQVERRFLELAAQRCPSLDPVDLWQDFLDCFLVPLVKELGAHTYRLITSSTERLEPSQLTDLIAKVGPKHAESLRQIAGEFLDPSSPSVRAFVLRLMNAFFFVQASGLNEETLKALASNGRRFAANIFIDTNVAFSLLGLHENPADEATRSMVGLIAELGKQFSLRLYVLPPTLDEITRVISKAQEMALKMRPSRNVAEVALQTSNLGITRKFIQHVATSPGPVDAREYFGVFLKNLIALLRSKSVELFNEDVTAYKTDQSVIDDLVGRLKFERDKYGASAKTYAELEHDCILWHFVNNKRPVRVESPLDAGYWVVTLDYRFLGFDSYLTKIADKQIPVSLHPASLVQMLQFWVPRTEQFEAAMLNAMRLPFLFHEYDPDAENVTVEILSALSRFENIGEMPRETVQAVLLNDVLRAKMAAEPDINQQIELIREALIEVNKNTAERLKEANESADVLTRELAKQTAEVGELSERIAKRDQAIEETNDLVKRLQSELAGLRKERADRMSRRSFVLKNVVGPVIATTAIVPLAVHAVNSSSKMGFWFYTVITWCVCVAIVLTRAVSRGAKTSSVCSWTPYKWLHQFQKFVIGTLLLPLISRIIWEIGRYIYGIL